MNAPGQLGSLQEAPLLHPLIKLNAIAYLLYEIPDSIFHPNRRGSRKYPLLMISKTRSSFEGEIGLTETSILERELDRAAVHARRFAVICTT